MIGRGFLWEAMPLAWELTNPMSVLFSITECRKTWNPIIRRPDAQGGTESRQDVITNQFFIENNQDNQELDPMTRLRQIMNHLLLQEYLTVTNDAYALVQLTEKSEILLSGQTSKETIMMKLVREQERSAGQAKAAGERKKKRKTAGAVILTEKEEILFEILRGLRAEIAREEKVPPYIVFSDKTLVFMSRIKPKNREEMLKVTGVGEYKLERYGLRFLETIRKTMC